jgi:hypothetical protein
MRTVMRAWPMLFAVLALAGCGRGDDPRVRELVTGARDVRCVHVSSSLTRCTARTGNRLVGERAWTCEFAYARSRGSVAYSGSESCWTDVR